MQISIVDLVYLPKIVTLNLIAQKSPPKFGVLPPPPSYVEVVLNQVCSELLLWLDIVVMEICANLYRSYRTIDLLGTPRIDHPVHIVVLRWQQCYPYCQ